ncbi:patatin-like phospholipase family protein [Ramlibacter henchirensis]|uniref:Patatin-like phospholipase family protein n=1 Tax=Ramlibacter henchirensis TaxID=204072 RepID=A0A4Z0BRX1_9BURK|nr:patatin-like phospholipase family protein [Ramlibacter henchirensis]TFZ00775.1 patatin-like phospholipase family protein [Ramlibacter henchirensis]
MTTTINLALQGGGSHGAFTWGVLDALLEDGRLSFEGISGTSAGAMNAVAMVTGWATARRAKRDPREAARESLAGFWDEVAALGAAGSVHKKLFASLWSGPLGAWGFLSPQPMSPYQFNPLDLNPLRTLLERRVDFEAIRRDPAHRVYVAATHVATGRAAIFHGRALTVEAVMASACLPQLFQASLIDGEAYWDGGFSANPALTPLVMQSRARDALIVQINPLMRPGTPRAAGEILDRVTELSFNASLLTQVRLAHAFNRLVENGAQLAEGRGPMRLHRVEGWKAMEDLPRSSRASADPVLIRNLFLAGRDSAAAWLERRFGDIGQRSTIDVEKEYGDDTWLKVAPPREPAVRRLPGASSVQRLLRYVFKHRSKR